MAGQTGTNYGVTISFAGGNLPPIAGEAKGFVEALMGTMVEITGPGSNFAKQMYGSNVGGSFSVSQKVQSKQSPYPPTMRNLQAVVTLQQDTGCTFSFPVLVESVKCTRNAKNSDTWEVDASCVKNGQETIVWNGTTLAYSPPVLTEQEVFDGTQKGTDPQAINTAYAVKYFLPLAGSTDAAANAAVDAWIAGATAPRTGLKVANVLLLRMDDAAGFLIAQWAMKDSVDEYVLAHTKPTLDPRNLQDDVTTAAVFVTNTPPSTPSAPVGLDSVALKLVTQSDDTLTPGSTGKTGRVWSWGRNDSKDQMERSLRHGTMIESDAHTIDPSARITIVAANASPPSTPSPPTSGVKINTTTLRYVTDDYSMWAFNFETMDSKDKRQLRKITIDPDGLDGEEEIPLVDATPSSVNSFPLYETESSDIGNSHVVNKAKFSQRGSRKTQMQNDGSEGSIGVLPQGSYERVFTLVGCLSTDDSRTIAQAYATTLKGTTTPVQNYPFQYLKWRRYHATQIAYTAFYQFPPLGGRVDNGAKIEIQNGVGIVKAKSWLGFNASQVPSVRISKVGILSRGSSKYLTQLTPYNTVGIGGPLLIKQRFTGSVPPLATSSIGMVNVSAFLPAILNYPAGSVQFLGADYVIVLNAGGSGNVYDITYRFQVSITANWVGFPTITGIPVGGLIHSTSQPNGGSDGDFAGTGTYPSYSWSALGITAVFPATDTFSFTSAWSQ